MRLEGCQRLITTLGCTAVMLVSSGAAAGLASTAIAVHRAPGQGQADVRTFAGNWFGHERSLTIGHRGHAKEEYGSGCCDPILTLWFVISHPTGTSRDARARARVTKVDVQDPSWFTPSNPAPHVGEVRHIRLRHHVIHEHLTHQFYCDRTSDRRGVCGA